MESLLNLENWFTLAMLIVLQAVLGFDNLLYISLESKRVEPSRQAFVRRMGIMVAIGLRIILLFVVLQAIQLFEAPFFSVHMTGIIEGDFNVHAFIVLIGGGFILYTAIKEIYHMIGQPDFAHEDTAIRRSVGAAVFLIVSMNMVFSFDSILSSIALSDVFWVMAVAILASGALMVLLADYVAEFLDRNRMYEVLGLFILLLVGVLLVSEGGHLAHLKLFGFEVLPMAKSTFYLVLFVMVAVDVVQSRYKNKLLAERKHEAALAKAAKAQKLEPAEGE